MSSPYLLQENSNYSYEFTTDQGIKYSLYFLDYTYLFKDYPTIAQNIYAFNIDAIIGDTNISKQDDRIGITILHVFNIFFQKITNVVIYVCDNSDNRDLARRRRFDLWFRKYNDGSLIKEEGMADVEGMKIYNAVILHKQNDNLETIVFAFRDLNEKASQK